jgi:hypothetical protein
MPPAFVLSQDQTLKFMIEPIAPTSQSQPKQKARFRSLSVCTTFQLGILAPDCSGAMCFVVTFRGHISSVFNHSTRTLNCPDCGPPPTCPFIQPTMRKSDTGREPVTRFLTSACFRGRRRVPKNLATGDRGGLWAVRNSPSTVFFQIFSGRTVINRKNRLPGFLFNLLKTREEPETLAGPAGVAPKCSSAGSGHLVGGLSARNP